MRFSAPACAYAWLLGLRSVVAAFGRRAELCCHSGQATAWPTCPTAGYQPSSADWHARADPGACPSARDEYKNEMAGMLLSVGVFSIGTG